MRNIELEMLADESMIVERNSGKPELRCKHEAIFSMDARIKPSNDDQMGGRDNWMRYSSAGYPASPSRLVAAVRSGLHQASFAIYHAMVRRSADSNVSRGDQPSSSRTLRASMP